MIDQLLDPVTEWTNDLWLGLCRQGSKQASLQGHKPSLNCGGVEGGAVPLPKSLCIMTD